MANCEWRMENGAILNVYLLLEQIAICNLQLFKKQNTRCTLLRLSRYTSVTTATNDSIVILRISQNIIAWSSPNGSRRGGVNTSRILLGSQVNLGWESS